MRRPKWMPVDTFARFVGKYSPLGGPIRCARMGCETEANTVDHIFPKIDGGGDELSNLQPMCLSHNSSKGRRADAYWSQKFYWDGAIDLSKLRISQSDFVYNAIADADVAEFFSRPISEISGKLLAFLQIVGAGKTLGQFALPFAINSIIRQRNPNAPRIDRMLIITKGQALREQIAHELQTEPVNYGIVPEAPKVLEITDSSKFLDHSIEYDVAVMCPNLLWQDVDINGDNISSSYKPSIKEGDVLRRHPLKIFDEFHYAHRKIHHFVQSDIGSLIFGFTASPIEATGGLLNDVVRISCYGYDQAARNDGSMKMLNSRRAEDVTQDGCINVITAEQQEVNGRWISVRDDAGNVLDNVADGLATVKAVADGVVRALHTLDSYSGPRKIAEHRDSFRGNVQLAEADYVSHGIITVADADTADDIAIYLNAVFSSNRQRFPLKGGWRALAVHGAANDRANQSIKVNHPFFSYKNRGKVDSSCCRILVVVDMAVEGMNNKFLNVLGVAERAGSVKEIVQRIGRVLRSSHTADEATNTIHVPCAVFDKAFIITHEAFRSREGAFKEVSTVETIDAAIDFTVNMERNTNNLENILDYIQADDVADRVGSSADARLGRFEKFRIISEFAHSRRMGKNPRTSRLVNIYARDGSAIKKDYVRAYVKSVENDATENYHYIANGEIEYSPVNAYEDFVNVVMRLDMPRPRDRILDDEREYVRPLSADELAEWLKTQRDSARLLALRGTMPEPEWQALAQDVYRMMGASYGAVSMSERMKAPLQEVDDLVTHLKQGLDVSGDPEILLREIVYNAVLHYLRATGIISVEQLAEGGTHNKTGITHVLRDRGFVEEMRGYVIAKLLQQDPSNAIFDLMPELRELEFFAGEPPVDSALWEDLRDHFHDAAE